MSKGRLLAILGVTFGLAVTIGNTIGAGILRTPGDIAAGLPSTIAFLSVWIVGGTYALLGANAVAELGTMTRRSGGQYAFVRVALGDYPGFVVGWADWVSTCGTTALVSIVVGEYVVQLLPALRNATLLALGVVVLLTFVQWSGVRAGAAAQDITSAAKAAVLLILVGCCFMWGKNPIAAGSSPHVSHHYIAYVVALQPVIYTYDGWTAVIYFSEEVKDPRRDIPRSMFGGLAAIIVIYLLINIAFLRVVPLQAIAGKSLAAATVAQALFGSAGETVIRAVLVVALLSAVNSNILMAPRVIFAMARDGLFLRRATDVNAGGTPYVALFISSALAVVFIVTGTVETVIAKLAFFFVASYTASFFSVFVMRRRAPDAERPYRAWGHPVTTGIAVLASAAFLVASVVADRTNSLWAVAILVLTVPVYLLLFRRPAR